MKLNEQVGKNEESSIIVGSETYVVERLAINHDPWNELVWRHKLASLSPMLERKLDKQNATNRGYKFN
jgi:protein-arginine kinase